MFTAIPTINITFSFVSI